MSKTLISKTPYKQNYTWRIERWHFISGSKLITNQDTKEKLAKGAEQSGKIPICTYETKEDTGRQNSMVNYSHTAPLNLKTLANVIGSLLKEDKNGF